MPESLESSLDAATNALASSGDGMADYSAPSSPGQKAEEAEATIPESGAAVGSQPPTADTPAASTTSPDESAFLAELVKLAGGGQPTDTTAQPSSPAVQAPASSPVDPIAALVARFDAMEQRLAQQGQQAPAQPAAPVQSNIIDPRTNAQTWMQARNEVYRQHARRDATRQELEMDLLKASAHLDRKELQEMRSGFTQTMRDSQVQAETQRVKNQIESLVKTRYTNLDNEPGQRMLNAFLAEAGAKGDKVDIEKVTREASEFLPKFILAVYAKRKSSNLRSLSGNMPRPGGTKAPAKPSFGSGFNSIDKATDAWVKSGRA